MHAINKKEHDNHQQHKTQDVDNEVRPGGTTSLGPSVMMVQAAALSAVNNGDVHKYDVLIIQGKIPSRRSVSKRYSTTRILNQKTPISMTQKHAC